MPEMSNCDDSNTVGKVNLLSLLKFANSKMGKISNTQLTIQRASCMINSQGLNIQLCHYP